MEKAKAFAKSLEIGLHYLNPQLREVINNDPTFRNLSKYSQNTKPSSKVTDDIPQEEGLIITTPTKTPCKNPEECVQPAEERKTPTQDGDPI